MADDKQFREHIQQLGKLIAEFDEFPESAVKAAANELIRLLMDVHGAGLERVMEIVFESGEPAPAIIEKLGRDAIVGSLLVLYSLHPDDLGTRVEKALERTRGRLRKHNATVELLRIEGGAVELRIERSGHTCGSTSREIKSMVEESVYEFAPDVASLTILGLDDPAPAGFVALESLLGHPLVPSSSSSRSLGLEGAD